MWEFALFVFQRITLREFAMWIIFVMIYALLTPTNLTEYLNQYTPNFFPNWLTYTDVAIMVLSLVSCWFWEWLREVIHEFRAVMKAKKLEAYFQHESSDESDAIVNAIWENLLHPTDLSAFSEDVISLLETKDIIQQVKKSDAAGKYQLTAAAIFALTGSLILYRNRRG